MRIVLHPDDVGTSASMFLKMTVKRAQTRLFLHRFVGMFLVTTIRCRIAMSLRRRRHCFSDTLIDLLAGDLECEPCFLFH